MAGLSRLPWALLEVLTSTDLSTAFRLLGRDVLELFRYSTGGSGIVLGGLDLAAAGGAVTVAPGVLLQPYAGVVSVPQADESNTVMGRLALAGSVDVPQLGVNTWYLIEARAGELDTFGPRLIDDQIGGQNPETILIQRETSMVLRATVGTSTSLPPLSAGWLPIGAVRRQAAADIASTDLYDLRSLLAEQRPATGEERFEVHDYAAQNLDPSGPPTLQVHIEVVDRFGSALSAHVPTIPLVALLEPGLTPTTSQWLYLYLCTVSGIAPRSSIGRGVLVISDKPPSTQGGRVPATPPVLPGPWNTLGTVRATCVGCLRTTLDLSVSYLIPQSCVRGRYSIAFGIVTQIPAVDTDYALAPIGGGDFIPRNARRMRLHALFASTASGSRNVYFENPGPDQTAEVPLLVNGNAVETTADIWVAGGDQSVMTVKSPVTGGQVTLAGADL